MVQRITVFLITCLTSFSVASLGSARVWAAVSPAQPSRQDTSQTVGDLTAQSPNAENSAGGWPASETPGTSAPTNPVLLAPGTRSADVTVLQRQLQQLGYYKGPIDGSYGPATQKAVQAFQQQLSLPTTGRLDQQTWVQMQTPQLFPSAANVAASPIPTEQANSTDSAASPTPSGGTAQPNPIPTSAPPTPASDSSPSPASTPIPSPSNSSTATPPTSPESPRPTSTAPQPSSSSRSNLWFMMALLGLLMVLASSILLGLYLWNRTRQTAFDPLLLGDDDEDLELPHEGAPNYRMASTASVPSTSVGSNGFVEKAIAPSVVEVPGTVIDTPSSSAAAGEEPARLARVNITDELMDELQGPDSAKRHKAIWELGQRGNSTAIPALIDAMLDADSKERSLILAALSEIGIRTIKPMNRALALSLQDENPEVRKNAIRDLTRVYDLVGQLSQMLGRAVQDPDIEVQETAQWALDQLGRIRHLGGSPYSPLQDASEHSPSLPEDSSRSRP